MDQRVSLVTLGVTDLLRARAFYETLGWRSESPQDSSVVFFQTGSSVLALWGRAELAADSGTEEPVALALNVRSPEEVDAVIEEARAAGATIVRSGAETFWGGYSGAFLDPEGHAWEVAHNPGWTLTEDGSVRL